MGVTIKDIAKAAGVSYSTVSKALLDSPLVKAPTKKKIVAIAKELNYQPNAAARRLASKKSNTVGVVWPTIERVTNSTLITLINKRLEELSYTTLLSINPVSDAVNTFNQFQVDAILMFDESGQSHVTTSVVPLISYGIASSNSPYPIVDVNRRKAIELAVHHLQSCGHTKISYVGNLEKKDRFQEEKVEGFIHAVKDCGIEVHSHSIITVEGLDQYDGYLAAKTILTNSNKPTAIISGSQDLARGILRAVQELNLSIPRDLSLISYDNIPQKEDLAIPLSTVGVPIDVIADKLTKVLLSTIDKKDVKKNIILQPELKITNSCSKV